MPGFYERYLKLPFNREEKGDQSFQIFRAQQDGNVRTETLKDGEYVVTPVIAMREGVVRGTPSIGPEFVPGKIITERVNRWNGLPIVVNHPFSSDGMPQSARDPSTYNQHFIGRIQNAEATSDGKALRLEAWINKDLVASTQGANEITERLGKGEMLEVSIGCSVGMSRCNSRGVPEEYRSQMNHQHAYQWTFVEPDHLAILTGDQLGACSNAMGCGTRAHQAGEPEENNNQLKTAANACDCSGEGGSCSCNNNTETKNMTEEEKKQLEVLMAKAMQDPENKEAVAKAFKEAGVEIKEPEQKEEQKAETSETPAKEEDKEAAATAEATGDANTAEKALKESKLGTAQKDEPSEAEKVEAYIQAAPKALQSILRNAMASHEGDRKHVITAIKALKTNSFTDDQLNAMDLDTLMNIAQLSGAIGGNNYGGVALPRANQGNEQEEQQRGYVKAPTLFGEKKQSHESTEKTQ